MIKLTSRDKVVIYFQPGERAIITKAVNKINDTAHGGATVSFNKYMKNAALVDAKKVNKEK